MFLVQRVAEKMQNVHSLVCNLELEKGRGG